MAQQGKTDKRFKMQERICRERYKRLVAYLIQSTTAMNETIRSLESDPLQSSPVVLLKESLASSRVLLTEVLIHPLIQDLLSCVLGSKDERGNPVRNHGGDDEVDLHSSSTRVYLPSCYDRRYSPRGARESLSPS
jgi:hypothetical protein